MRPSKNDHDMDCRAVARKDEWWRGRRRESSLRVITPQWNDVAIHENERRGLLPIQELFRLSLFFLTSEQLATSCEAPSVRFSRALAKTQRVATITIPSVFARSERTSDVVCLRSQAIHGYKQPLKYPNVRNQVSQKFAQERR